MVKFCKNCKYYNKRGEYGFVCDFDWGYFYAYGGCDKWEHRQEVAVKKRKLKNKAFRLMEKINKLDARKLKSKKCHNDCYLFQHDYPTHNGCITCPCCKNTPFYTKGAIYRYFRNKRTRRECWQMCPFQEVAMELIDVAVYGLLTVVVVAMCKILGGDQL